MYATEAVHAAPGVYYRHVRVRACNTMAAIAKCVAELGVAMLEGGVGYVHMDTHVDVGTGEHTVTVKYSKVVGVVTPAVDTGKPTPDDADRNAWLFMGAYRSMRDVCPRCINTDTTGITHVTYPDATEHEDTFVMLCNHAMGLSLDGIVTLTEGVSLEDVVLHINFVALADRQSRRPHVPLSV